MQTAEHHMDFMAAFLLLASPAIGSFAATLADRIGAGVGLGARRSACDHCGRPLPWASLVPILSWLIQRGRSRCCEGALTGWYPLSEIAALALAIWAWLVADGLVLAISVMLGWVLLTLSLIDIRTFRLPDPGTLGLIIAGLALSVAGLTGPPIEHAAGAALGYGALAGLAWFWRRFRGIDGLGLGDAKLLAAAGAWAGALALPSVLVWACLIGLSQYAVKGLIHGRDSLSAPIPFGPAIALGFWITWLHGPLL